MQDCWVKSVFICGSILSHEEKVEQAFGVVRIEHQCAVAAVRVFDGEVHGRALFLEPRGGAAHGLSTHEQVTDTRRIEGEKQLVHFPGDASANSRSTESFQAFNSACEENRRLLKFGNRGAADAGTTVGLAAHSRYLAL